MTLERVIGHRDTGRTACPGVLLYAQLDDLRTMVATGVGAAPTSTARLSATLADYSIDFGEPVPVSGLLAGPDGLALAGASVEVQTNADGRWMTSKRLTTAADGTFAGELRPRKRMYVRLRYPGQAELRGAYSSRLLLRLRPGDHAAPAAEPRQRRGARARAGQRRTAQAAVHRGAPAADARALPHRRRAKPVRARKASFATSFVPAFRAVYRYAVVAKSDDDTDRGSTGWRTLRVR